MFCSGDPVWGEHCIEDLTPFPAGLNVISSVLPAGPQDAKALLRAVADIMPPENFSAELVVEAQSIFVCDSKDTLLFWADTSCMASKVAATCCYLGQKYVGGASPESMLDSSEAFKADVVLATAVLRSARFLKPILARKMATDGGASHSLKPSIHGWQAWCERVGQVEALWGQALVTAALDRVTSSTGELAKLTPVYSHIVTARKINVAMVRKVLLHSKIRGPLSEKTIALHKAMALAKATMSEWGVSPVPKAEGEEEDQKDTEMSCADIAFQEAKKAISVIAACSVVYEPGSSSRQAEAATLIAVDRPEIVKPLWDELVQISKGKPALKSVEDTK